MTDLCCKPVAALGLRGILTASRVNDGMVRRTLGAGRTAARLGILAMLGGVLMAASGCAVPQPRGSGRLEHIVEPTTSRGYWLYLPKDYVAAGDAAKTGRRWPVVVSFHGMKPFDNARPQALEWEQEADRYGFLIVAPELRAPDVLAEFPVQTVSPAIKKDEEASLAIMNHVMATTQADPANVLSTSWSSGGYMAHYMMNRHPERFTCLAVRQSNFSRRILDPNMTARSIYHPILIVNTEKDFQVCKDESRDAVEWYKSRGYRNVYWVYIRSLGHERTPDIAADFFGRSAGVQPNRKADVLVHRQAIDGNAEGLAFLAGKLSTIRTSSPSPADGPLASATPTNNGSQPVAATPISSTANAKPVSQQFAQPPLSNPKVTVTLKPPQATPARPTPGVVSAQPAPQPPPVTVRRPPAAEPAVSVVNSTPARSGPQTPRQPTEQALGISVSSAIGVEPLHLAFSADCSSDWQRSADFLWTLNGQPICEGVNGQKTISEPGEHTLGLLVVTGDGLEHRSYRLVRVLPRLSAAGFSDGSTH